MALLDGIHSPDDFRGFTLEQLKALSAEVRERILSVVSETGGHLASSLGAVELTVALHYAYDTPYDKIIWDVGHQCYAHKILTGRNAQFPTIRQQGGLSGFPRTSESPYDVFDVGHASTSISVALGLVEARGIRKEDYDVVAVIGDGSMTGGLAFEGLNNAGVLKKNITVILNDNKMSISPNVGAIASYLTRVISDSRYNKLKGDIWEMTGKMKTLGSGIRTIASRVEDTIKGALLPGRLFADLGFRYFGPIDGHNIEEMTSLFNNIRKNIQGPVLIHVITKKGKGYKHAEKNAPKFHGIGGFEMDTGEAYKKSELPTYSSVFGNTLIRIAEQDNRIVGITAAMPTGTGLDEFGKRFPDRYFDVGIAESHAVTFAGGLAKSGMRPVVVMYSTFLQRAYDQIIHDVALQNLDVVFCIDRAGLTPDDGPTHHGAFDMAFLRLIPNVTIMAPKDENELQQMLWTALHMKGPVFIRYPKGYALGVPMEENFKALPIGEPEIVKQGQNILILSIGEMVGSALDVGKELEKDGLSPTIVNMRFVKPISKEKLKSLVDAYKYVFTIEAGTIIGGLGSAVLEFMDFNNIISKKVEVIGYPDAFIPHGTKTKLLEEIGLSVPQIADRIRKTLT